jgi:hypothetical protein
MDIDTKQHEYHNNTKQREKEGKLGTKQHENVYETRNNAKMDNKHKTTRKIIMDTKKHETTRKMIFVCFRVLFSCGLVLLLMLANDFASKGSEFL